jgi:hypothetical protein
MATIDRDENGSDTDGYHPGLVRLGLGTIPDRVFFDNLYSVGTVPVRNDSERR